MSFRVIIAGGRTFENYKLLKLKMDKILKDVVDEIIIISGTAGGADTLGEKYASERGYKIKRYPAEWDNLDGVEDRFIKENKFGKPYNSRAGHDRNLKMAQNTDALVAFWNKLSPGTKDMIDIATNLKLKVRVVYY